MSGGVHMSAETHDVVRDDANLIRLQQVVKLTQVCHQAKREFPKVGSAEHPTPWDCLHLYLDELLTELVGH